MKSKNINLKRRTLLKGALSGVAVVAVTGVSSLSRAKAAHHESSMPDHNKAMGNKAMGDKLDENYPAAANLGYKHDATKVDVEKYPKRAGEAGAKQFCDNCVLYSAEANAEWGKCTIFPGKLVNGKGWCSAWALKG